MGKVIEFREWARNQEINDRPWLLLGKGPSFSKISQVNIENFRICTLNHVIRQVPADIAHVIDLDVVQDCAEAIYHNASVLAMPYRPHINCRPTERTIEDLVSEVSVLKVLAAEGRLLWYNAATSKKKNGDSPIIQVKFFSAEAALNLLAACGVRTVRSLGVDGGSSYSSVFSDLDDKTLLINGHTSFDRQFEGIARTIRTTGIFYAPLHIQAPVKVFVGSDAAQLAGVKVLEYSIKKFASMSVDVTVIDDREISIPKNPANRSRTGFSFSRFHIPRLCSYKGRGIYFDADMQVFADIRSLWTWDMSDADVIYAESDKDGARIPQFSVMLLNCSELDWDINRIIAGLDNGSFDYGQLMQQLCIMPAGRRKAKLPFAWNSLEHYEPGKTCLIHYTDMPTQPWVSDRNRNGQLWYDCAREGINEGFISKDFLYDEVGRGNVSPDLPGWLGLPEPVDLDNLRTAWIPPYRRFTGLTTVPQVGITDSRAAASTAVVANDKAGVISGAVRALNRRFFGRR